MTSAAATGLNNPKLNTVNPIPIPISRSALYTIEGKVSAKVPQWIADHP